MCLCTTWTVYQCSYFNPYDYLDKEGIENEVIFSISPLRSILLFLHQVCIFHTLLKFYLQRVYIFMKSLKCHIVLHTVVLNFLLKLIRNLLYGSEKSLFILCFICARQFALLLSCQTNPNP